MKKTVIASSVLICTISLSFFQSSCIQIDSVESNCIAMIMDDTLRFNLFDMDTKGNLFPPVPRYEPEHLKLFRKSPTSTSPDGLLELPLSISESLGEEHFQVTVSAGIVDTLYIQILTQPFDTITYTLKEAPSSLCPKYILDAVSFNGEHVGDNAHNRVVHFYRKE